jgi:uncharacterized protein (DUF362 family)
MKNGNASNTVIVRRCESYDREAIGQIVSEGMDRLGYAPRGRVFVKPNVVFAGDPAVYDGASYTATELVGAALAAIAGRDDVARVDMGENCGIGFPTRLYYEVAGYYDEVRRVRRSARCPVGIFCMDEALRDPVFIGGRVHDVLRVSRQLARADSRVYLPKLKCHCVSNMTGAVKLNIGICSDDERSIRHDFLLDEKIVDLLGAGYPDFIVMDAVEVGVGNEGFPYPRKLGLILMGTNPVAVDLVGARLLGYDLDQVPYLAAAVARGYAPASIDEVVLEGDLTTLAEIDEQAKRAGPYDDVFYRWQDIRRDLERLECPIRFYFGPYSARSEARCLTGCVMGLKIFLATYERFAGPEAFAGALPVVFVIGRIDEEIDAGGQEAFLLGSCARADIVNAKRVIRIDRCFTTVSDMSMRIGHRLGMPSPGRHAGTVLPIAGAMVRASLVKLFNGRYFQDMGYFFSRHLERRL